MDFQNKYFQEFIRMKDSEVEKLLDRHLRSAKYFKYHEIAEKIGETKSYIYLSDNSKLNIEWDISCYKYTFKQYLNDKKEFTKSFFKTIGKESTLKFIERRAIFYYGEENVWRDESSGSVIIRFPEVTITNSLEDSHIMKDLFFKLICHYDKGFGGIALARTTFNQNEIGTYVFSHLSGNSIAVYSNSLCFGETDLSSWIKRAKGINDFRFIDKIIVSLGGYLAWESLEGVPYRKFGDCKKQKMDGIKSDHLDYRTKKDSEIEKALTIISNSDLKFSYTAKVNDDGDTVIKIKNTNDIDELLKHKSIRQFIRYENQSYSRLNKQADKNASDYNSKVIFKNQIVPVVFEPSDFVFEPEYACHIMLLTDVIAILEEKLFNYLIEIENE